MRDRAGRRDLARRARLPHGDAAARRAGSARLRDRPQHRRLDPVRPRLGIRRAGRGHGRSDGGRARRVDQGRRDRWPGSPGGRADSRDPDHRPAPDPRRFTSYLRPERERQTSVKTAQSVHVYLLGDLERFGFPKRFAELGLEAEQLTDMTEVTYPAMILAAPGLKGPEGMADITINPPVDTSPAALRVLLRIAMENIALKPRVTQPAERASPPLP